MKVLIDANVLLDVLMNREPYVQDSLIIWKLCETQRIHGSVCALSVADIVYIMRKEVDPEKTEKTLNTLSLIFDFEELTPADLEKAAALRWNDFEDAVQSVTAERIRAGYIITRNTKDFSDSHVPAISPESFLKSII